MGIRQAIFLPITMVDNTVPTQGSLKMVFLGVCEDKLWKTVIKDVYYIQIKTILIILIKACHHHTLIQACHPTLIFVSTLHFFSYLFTVWGCTPSSYTILWIFIFSATQFYSLLCVRMNTGVIGGINAQL